MLVSIPGQVSREMWGFLVSAQPTGPGEYWVVFDVLVSPVPESSDYQVNSVVKVQRGQILQILRKDKRDPMIRIQMTPEGEIIGIRRIDGKTEPIVVQVDEGDLATVYRVDHKGWKEMD